MVVRSTWWNLARHHTVVVVVVVVVVVDFRNAKGFLPNSDHVW